MKPCAEIAGEIYEGGNSVDCLAAVIRSAREEVIAECVQKVVAVKEAGSGMRVVFDILAHDIKNIKIP